MSVAGEDRERAQAFLDDLGGRQFGGFRMGWGVRLDLVGDPEYEIIAECPLRITVPGEADWWGEPLRAEVAGRLLPLLSTRIDAVSVEPDSTLTVSFDSGARVIVPADWMYEAWHVGSDDGLLIVCLPGGGISITEP